MEPMAIALVILAIILSIVNLGLSTRPPQFMPSDRRLHDSPLQPERIHVPKTIVVKLPESSAIPEDYAMDLRISIYKPLNSADKVSISSEGTKKTYRRLDDYF